MKIIDITHRFIWNSRTMRKKLNTKIHKKTHRKKKRIGISDSDETDDESAY